MSETNRRDFFGHLAGGAAALAVGAPVAPEAEEHEALRRIDAWIAESEQQELFVFGSAEHNAFITAHPKAGLITAALFRDLLVAIRYMGRQGR